MDRTMNVFNEEPRMVVCISNEKDSWFPNAELLEVGKIYHLTDVYRDSWHTDVVISEFPDLKFNSCTFRELEDGDISLIDLIPYGKDNAISRKMLVEKADFYGLIPNNVRSKDRYTRKLLQKAREDNVIIAKPTGGYYIPDEDDATELAVYIATEHSRALAIHSDLVMANRVFEDMVHGRLKKPERRYGD
jgi:hypothetical protein